MTTFRVLHVDDEPDIREVVEIALDFDPAFAVRGCASGSEALAAAAEWAPNLILLDVMMPVMDGPTTLARLRKSPQTAAIPVVFMTARAQPRELERFIALGAEGVIAKPFDPMTLAAAVRSYARTADAVLATRRDGFLQRARSDAVALARCRAGLGAEARPPIAVERIRAIAHGLAGAGGTFSFHDISSAAARLEDLAIKRLAGAVTTADVERALDELLNCIERR